MVFYRFLHEKVSVQFQHKYWCSFHQAARAWPSNCLVQSYFKLDIAPRLSSDWIPYKTPQEQKLQQSVQGEWVNDSSIALAFDLHRHGELTVNANNERQHRHFRRWALLQACWHLGAWNPSEQSGAPLCLNLWLTSVSHRWKQQLLISLVTK